MADSKKYDGSQWEHSLRKLTTATADIEPTIYTDGTAITSYTIKGNTTQSGTPTPSNPVDANGVGERTENLCNVTSDISVFLNLGSGSGYEYTINADKTITNPEGKAFYGGFRIKVKPNTTYTCHCVASKNGQMRLAEYSDIITDFYTNKIKTTVNVTIKQVGQGYGTVSFTTTAETKWVLFYFYIDGAYSPNTLSDIMFLEGEYDRYTIPDYIPYGFKIPISTLQTINNYLGSIQSTRQINKIVFDGTETGWDKGTYAFYYTINDMYIRSQVICTHYEYYDGTSSSAPTNSISTASGVGTSIWIKTADHDTTTLDQWKAYLQAQYAAGTPVTVYYVLNTATTGTVNEPLMAIGTYADSISNAAAIPTTDGANSISVDTTVQPSEFSATWTGWHDSSVKEKSENLFDKDNTTIENGYLYDAGTSFSWTAASDSRSVKIPCEANTQYTLSVTTALPIFRIGLSDDSNPSPRGITCTKVVNGSNINQYTFTTGASDKYIIFQGTGSMVDTWISELMLVEGSTAPSQYEPYWK